MANVIKENERPRPKSKRPNVPAIRSHSKSDDIFSIYDEPIDCETIEFILKFPGESKADG